MLACVSRCVVLEKASRRLVSLLFIHLSQDLLLFSSSFSAAPRHAADGLFLFAAPAAAAAAAASRNKYVVVGLGGATVRMAARLDSPVVRTLPQGTVSGAM